MQAVRTEPFTLHIVSEEEVAELTKQRIQHAMEQVDAMSVAPDKHHLLKVSYDFLGSDEEAEALMDDGEEIELLFDIWHPRDCIEHCRKEQSEEACGILWQIAYLGFEDAFGYGDTEMPTEAGTWEIEFRSDGYGEETNTWIAFLEDDE